MCGCCGHAFILQKNSNNFQGATSDGMGYSGIENAVAFEFDTWRTPSTSDPDTTNARHISVIANKGKNLGNEKYSYGYNDNPLNFKVNLYILF